MPIILLWNETTAGSERRIGRWLSSMADSNRSQTWWLRQQLARTQSAERASRAYPVFRFQDEAVTARVSGTQRGALLDGPVPTLGQHLAAAVDEWNLVREWRDANAGTLLLPGLIRVLAELVQGVGSSIARHRTPTRATFDLTTLDAADLPGLAALAFRAFGRDRAAILGTARTVRGALDEGSPPQDAPGTAAPGLPLEMQLDEITRYVVAGLLVVPALAALVPRMAQDLRLAVEHGFLELVEGIEGTVHDLRRDVLTVFAVDLPGAAEQALIVAGALRTFATDTVRFGGLLAVEILQATFDGVATFAGQLRTAIEGLTGVITTVGATGQAIVDLDIGSPLHHGFEAINSAINNLNPLLRGDPWDPPDEYSVTVGQLVLGEGPGARAQRDLRAGVEGLRTAWDRLAFEDFHDWLITSVSGYSPPAMIEALDRLVEALGHPRYVHAPVPELSYAGMEMADLGARVVEPMRGRADALLTRLETTATTAVQGLATAVQTGLTSTADAAEQAATRAAHERSVRLLGTMLGDVDDLVESVLGDQGAPTTTTPFDDVAAQYASWLVQGGFDVVGAAMAGYVTSMLDLWWAEVEANADTPVEITETSPRAVLERARLGRVHSRRMRLAVPAGDLGAPLAAQIADRFEQEVRGAYRAGQERLGERLEAAAPEAA